MVGGSRATYCVVGLPYMQVKALRKIAHTIYIFPTALKEVFKFFLKSTNLKFIYYVAEKPLYRHTNCTHGFII